MKQFRQIFIDLGWDGITLLLSGLLAVIIGVLDFTPFGNFQVEDLLKLIIISVGLLLSATAAQVSRRANEMREFREGLKDNSIELCGNNWRIQGRAHVIKAQGFVADTFLYLHSSRKPTERKISNADSKDPYYSAVFERVRKREIVYKCVIIIRDKRSLEQAISTVIPLKGKPCFFRYYEATPSSLPLLNFTSVDDQYFYFGGAIPRTTAHNSEDMVFVKNQNLAKLLTDYWEHLWYSARPLNDDFGVLTEELKEV